MHLREEYFFKKTRAPKCPKPKLLILLGFTFIIFTPPPRSVHPSFSLSSTHSLPHARQFSVLSFTPLSLYLTLSYSSFPMLKYWLSLITSPSLTHIHDLSLFLSLSLALSLQNYNNIFYSKLKNVFYFCFLLISYFLRWLIIHLLWLHFFFPFFLFCIFLHISLSKIFLFFLSLYSFNLYLFFDLFLSLFDTLNFKNTFFFIFSLYLITFFFLCLSLFCANFAIWLLLHLSLCNCTLANHVCVLLSRFFLTVSWGPLCPNFLFAYFFLLHTHTQTHTHTHTHRHTLFLSLSFTLFNVETE